MEKHDSEAISKRQSLLERFNTFNGIRRKTDNNECVLLKTTCYSFEFFLNFHDDSEFLKQIIWRFIIFFISNSNIFKFNVNYKRSDEHAEELSKQAQELAREKKETESAEELILELKAKLGFYQKVTKSDKDDSFDENNRDDFLM